MLHHMATILIGYSGHFESKMATKVHVMILQITSYLVIIIIILSFFRQKFVRRISRSIFASQWLRFGSPFSPPLADLEYIFRIRALIFHWLRLPVHVSNQKTFYTEHMLSTKCKQRCHFPFWFQMKTSFPSAKALKLFTWLTVSASKLNLSQISFSSLRAAIFNSPTYV